MPSISRSALVAHSAAKMYDLVCDIESYPEFLPWCANATIDEQSETHQVASVHMDKRMRSTSFTTRNSLEPNKAINMGLVEGPFKTLTGAWRFTEIDEQACKVELSIEFQFKSRIFAALMSGAFSKICDTMVAAFVERADDIYGSEASSSPV